MLVPEPEDVPEPEVVSFVDTTPSFSTIWSCLAGILLDCGVEAVVDDDSWLRSGTEMIGWLGTCEGPGAEAFTPRGNLIARRGSSMLLLAWTPTAAGQQQHLNKMKS